MEAVVAAQSSEGTKSDGIGEENLSAGVNPHLTKQESFFTNFSFKSLMISQNALLSGNVN